MRNAFVIEDYLDEHEIFVNGLSGRPGSLGAYMTVIDPGKLKAALEESDFTEQELIQASDYWKRQAYLSPSFGLLACWVLKFKQAVNLNS
jgi:hypothetical protein